MTATLRAGLRAVLTLLWLLLWIIPAFLVFVTRLRGLQLQVQRIMFACVLRLWGVRLHVSGQPSPQRPLLLVTNHQSYLDVLVLGVTAMVQFTPKAEIAAWPIIGFFCRMAGCVFIDRRRTSTGKNRAQLEEELRRGARLCLFPEGTTSDGTQLLAFRSSFLTVAEEGRVPVQAAAIRYTAQGRALFR